MSVGPLGQRTMPDAIADVLRAEILSGRLPPASPLREVHVAGELGVSRAPLREALRLLQDEGLVERRPFKGAVVATVTADEVRAMAVVRQRVEPLAVQLGLPALRADDAAELRAAVTALADVTADGDMAGSIEAHLAVHRLLYERSGNSVLVDMWRSWESRLRLFWVVDHQSFARLTDVVASHQRLLDLIVAGDVGPVDAELQGHVLGSVAPLDGPDAAERYGGVDNRQER